MSDDSSSRNDVGRMVDSSQADDRKMIRLVRERRLLYARNNMPVASYYTRVKALWAEVAKHMGWTGNMTLCHLPPERLRSHYLCIDHFDEKYIRANRRRISLRRDAIPERHQGPDITFKSSPLSPSSSEGEFKVLPPKRVYRKKEPHEIIESRMKPPENSENKRKPPENYENKRKPPESKNKIKSPEVCEHERKSHEVHENKCKSPEIREEAEKTEQQFLCRKPSRRHSADMTDAEKFADVRRKWSHIRNSYSRHLRNEMHGARTGKGRMVSRWYLADELEFLREHMATDIRPTFSSYPSMVEMDTVNGSDQESKPESLEAPFINPWFALSQAKVEPKRETFSNDDSCSSAFDPDENSSFFQFFRGIYSDFQDLPPKKQRLFKRKCLDFLHELLDEDDVPPSLVYQSDAINLTRFSRPSSEDERDPTSFCVVEKVEVAES